MSGPLVITAQRYPDARTFLDEAGPFLAELEAEHNLIFGICATLLVDPDGPAGPPYLASVHRGEAVVAAAVMTPPHNMVVSCTDDGDALAALIRNIDQEGLRVPGITASVEVAHDFIDLWAPARALAGRRTIAERIYRLERVTPPIGVRGHMRVATIADRDTLIDFAGAFLREALHNTDHDEPARLVDASLRTGSRTWCLWDDDGPVSVAGVTGPTPNGIRIGPVYTPPEVRRRGYASAVTAAASQAQLDLGRKFVFLFTDLSNPTSNKIYQQIGFERVIDIDQWTFETP